ncbi:hypothetical protein JA1_000680 [Spathaspora sp. JA1]|nr:hypothetical protein JA1_000680 [Spathaspora sp. JA1]
MIYPTPDRSTDSNPSFFEHNSIQSADEVLDAFKYEPVGVESRHKLIAQDHISPNEGIYTDVSSNSSSSQAFSENESSLSRQDSLNIAPGDPTKSCGVSMEQTLGIVNRKLEEYKEMLMRFSGCQWTKCPTCDNNFFNIKILKEHCLKVHDTDKIYSCYYEECCKSGKSAFTRKNDLKRHIRSVHLKMKDHICFQVLGKDRFCGCLKAFDRADHLNKHLDRDSKAGCLRAWEN